MTIEIWLTFVAASMVLLLMPGPTTLTVISYSLTHGNKAKIPIVLAVALGDSTALALSLLGLGVLLAESAFWFQVLKWAGGLYLIFLGIKLIREGLNPVEVKLDKANETGLKPFINIYMVTALNPKGIMFFVAFLPLFIDTSTSVTPQLWLLAVTFVTLATIDASFFAIFASKVQRLMSSAKAQQKLNLFGGTVLSAAGVWAVTAK